MYQLIYSIVYRAMMFNVFYLFLILVYGHALCISYNLVYIFYKIAYIIKQSVWIIK